MGRKNIIRSIVLNNFSKDGNSKVFKCRYCSQEYALNVTRMSNHLLVKCVRCPKKVKIEIRQKSKAFGNLHESFSSYKKTVGIQEEAINSIAPVTVADGDGGGDNAELSEDMDSENNPSSSSNSMSISFTDSAINRCKSTSVQESSSSNLDSFVDKISDSQQDKVWKLLARACYASNTPLSFVDCSHWQNLFKAIKPSLKLPSRYQLSNSLLDNEYKRVSSQVFEKITAAVTLGIQLDGWSNIRNESIINILITTPDAVLYKVIDTKLNRHDSSYLGNLIASTIDELGGVNRIMSIITDNASNMRATWALLKEQYPDSYFTCYGCTAHILNLLTCDVLKINFLSSIVQKCKAIVSTIRKSHILNSTFAHIQKEQHNLNKTSSLKSVKLPAQTRWPSVIFCLESLKLNKQNLKQLAIIETVQDVLNSDVKSDILDDSFWHHVQILFELLQPLSGYFIKIQTEKSCISDVVEIFHNLDQIFNEKSPLMHLNVLRDCLEKRRKMAVTPVHLAANLLDPKYMGQNLSADEYIESLSYINKMSTHLVSGSNIGQVMSEVAQYKAKEGLFAKEFLWDALRSNTLSSTVWWKSLCLTTSLSKVAAEILNCPATTCSTERSFSVFGNIQNKKRNKLTNDRAAKLLFINYNLRLNESSFASNGNDQEENNYSASELVPIDSDSESESQAE